MAAPLVPAAPALRALADRLPSRPLTRFAPSPTGYLHLGHVVNAIYVWGLARALGGRVLLRLEDHDRARCRPEYEAAIIEDLEWLGLEPDVGDPASLRAGSSPYRQSDVPHVYDEALELLRQRAHVYACECSRKQIADTSPTADGLEARYSGRCRQRGLPPGPGRGLRVVIDPGLEAFDDARLGVQVQDPHAQCGDLLVQDRHRYWTYQFAVVVDDVRHGVDLVIRGEDLLASTGRQLRVARLLGRDRLPVFVHHGLLAGPTGEKLSKSNRDTGVRDLRAAGRAPGEVLGLAAAACGLTRSPALLSPHDLASLFA